MNSCKLIYDLWNVAPVRQTVNNLDDVAVLDPVDWLLKNYTDVHLEDYH